jgi:molecular chaperone GrpE
MRDDHYNQCPILANLYQGINMTDAGLNRAFERNGLTKFGSRGEKFDPNMHDALFEYPDEMGGVAPGHIGQLMKVGFMLNNRVVRPAEVGVVKAS